MTAALKYEWARLTTLRSTWWISGGSILVGVGFTFFVAMMIQFNTPTELVSSVNEDYSRFILDGAMTQFSNVDPSFYLLAYVVAILGVLAWGHEYRHGMIRATLTAVPDRTSVWLAKLVVVGAWVAVVVVISCVLSLLVTLVWFAGLDFDFAVAVAQADPRGQDLLDGLRPLAVTLLHDHQPSEPLPGQVELHGRLGTRQVTP